MLGGVIIVVVGVLSFDESSRDSEAGAATVTATDGIAASTVVETSPSSGAPATTTVATQPTTTSATTTSSTTVEPPATTVDVGVQIEAFVSEFAAATESDDVEFLLARLHPLSVQASDEPTCASFVAREIVALEQYGAAGPAERTALEFTIAGQGFTVDPAFEVPVAFTFSGQEFTDIARFAPVDGVMHYFATCR